jgi:hypothetical protein
MDLNGAVGMTSMEGAGEDHRHRDCKEVKREKYNWDFDRSIGTQWAIQQSPIYGNGGNGRLRGGGETFIVKSSSTPGTPAVAKGYSCAETLGILYSLGFETVNAVPYTEGTQGGTLYTLVQR